MSVKSEIIAYLKESFDLEPEDAMGLITEFVPTIDDYTAQTDELLASGGGWEELGRIGHTIKGTSANIGAESLRAAGLELEMAGKGMNAAGCQAANEKIKALINELR